MLETLYKASRNIHLYGGVVVTVLELDTPKTLGFLSSGLSTFFTN